MLEKLEPEIAELLLTAHGRSYETIIMPELTKGSVLRAETDSGNCYFFEVDDPENWRAGVYRCQARQEVTTTGFLGIRHIDNFVRVGASIYHDREHTARVTKLTIIDPAIIIEASI